MTKQIITAETVRLAWKAGQSVIVYAGGDIVTQQARDDARHHGITLTTEDLLVPGSTGAESTAPAAAPARPVREESSEPQHVPTPTLTAEQLTAATRQLQEVLAPLTQALAASARPAETPTPRPTAVEQAVTVVSAPAEQDDLFTAIRRGVLAALPAGSVDEAFVDQLIHSVLSEMGHGAEAAASGTRPGVRQAAGVTHVDSSAQLWGSSRNRDSVSVMDVLSPAKGDAAAVGYLDWENLSFSWTFRRAEVLVVLEGELNLSIEGTTFSAVHGDVFSIPAGTEVELSSSGHVRCTTVAVAAEPRS